MRLSWILAQPNGACVGNFAGLREREVARAGTELAASKPMPFRATAEGEAVSGKFTGTVQLSSGKFAIVEKTHGFTLVPWRPVIDRQLGSDVMGAAQGGSVLWQLGRQRGLKWSDHAPVNAST